MWPNNTYISYFHLHQANPPFLSFPSFPSSSLCRSLSHSVCQELSVSINYFWLRVQKERGWKEGRGCWCCFTRIKEEAGGKWCKQREKLMIWVWYLNRKDVSKADDMSVASSTAVQLTGNLNTQRGCKILKFWPIRIHQIIFMLWLIF